MDKHAVETLAWAFELKLVQHTDELLVEVHRATAVRSSALNLFGFTWRDTYDLYTVITLVLELTSSSTSLSCSSRAFCSLPITRPSSCSSSPFWVTVKSTRVTWSSSRIWRDECGVPSNYFTYLIQAHNQRVTTLSGFIPSRQPRSPQG